MSNKYFSSIHWCNCPKKFGGQHCEIDKSKTCYEGNGHFYRGKASTDTMGRSCLAWNSATVLQQTYHAHRSDALQLGLGSTITAGTQTTGGDPGAMCRSA